MKKCVSFILAVFLMLIPLVGSAHSGRTDANGGHYNRKTGEYHYHNGGKTSSDSSSKSSTKKTTYKIVASNMPKSIQVGESMSLDWTVDGSSVPVTWSSSNSSVVSVSTDGLLTAKAKGEAKIYADYSGTRATWSISVKAVLITAVDIPQTRMLLQVGESDSLAVTITPLGASDKSVAWKSGNPKIATVSDLGQATAIYPGIASITVTAKDGSKKADSIDVYVIDDILETDFPIHKESEQADIATIQTILVVLGDLNGKADGKYGTQTSAAILRFQERNGVEQGECTFDLYRLMLDELNRVID